MSFTDSEKIGYLFKKAVGKPSTNPTLSFYEEQAIFARPNILTKQIFSKELKDTIPDLTVVATGTLTGSDDAYNYTSQFETLEKGDTSSWSHIKKYTKLQLNKVASGNDVAFKHALLVDSIPSDYDPLGSYGVLLYKNNGTTAIPFDGTWVLDNETGVVTFFVAVSGVDEDNPPVITFYRYEGAKGLTSASQLAGQDVTTGGFAFDNLKVGYTGSLPADEDGIDLLIRQGIRADIVYANSLVSLSDARFKNEITPIENPIDIIQQLNGITHKWIHKENINKEYGFLAQELNDVLPELVVKDRNGVLGVKYGKLNAILVECIKQQQNDLTSHKKDIVKLKEEINTQTEMLKMLISQLIPEQVPGSPPLSARSNSFSDSS